MINSFIKSLNDLASFFALALKNAILYFLEAFTPSSSETCGLE